MPTSHAAFDEHRGMLVQLAYRMLGTLSDAEDIVQEAWLRWSSQGREAVRNPGGFLRRVVTRLCIDHLRREQARREAYRGPWLPEPLVEDSEPEDVTLPLLLALERLSPLERAAFLLHDVFGQGFDEIAGTLGREPAACRQLASRARKHVRADRPRHPLPRAEGLAIAEAFFEASRMGDAARLAQMLASDVRVHSDGGGKRESISRVIAGHDLALRTFVALARLSPPGGSQLVQLVTINGLPGFVSRETDGLMQTTALLVEDGRIASVFIMRNPDKLTHVGHE